MFVVSLALLTTLDLSLYNNIRLSVITLAKDFDKCMKRSLRMGNGKDD